MTLCRITFCLFIGLALSLSAAEPKVETVVDGLTNPCGVAIQPETGVVFVADSGAGRIIRIVDGKVQEVITGSPRDVYGKGPKYEIGPLGLAFFDKDTLVVGDGGYADGEEFVRVFAVPPTEAAPLNYEQGAKLKAGPLPAVGELKAEGNFYGLAISKTAVYVTSNGDDAKGWLHRLPIEGTKFGKLERWIATKEAVGVDAPTAITLTPRGEILIGQMGEVDKPGDSLLTFYSASTGKKLLNLETGLHDITGLAYHPKNGLLYAVDFAWQQPEAAGLYRIDRGARQGDPLVKISKIVSLEKPTAMAFAADGSLYVTCIGSPGANETAAKTGKLIRITVQ